MIRAILILTFTLCFAGSALSQKGGDYTLSVQKAPVKQGENYLVEVTLTNNKPETLYYYSMSCSWQDFYQIDNDLFTINGSECDKNVPVVLSLVSGKSTMVMLSLSPINSPGKLITFRIGFNLLQPTNPVALPAWEDMLDKNVVWTDEVSLP